MVFLSWLKPHDWSAYMACMRARYLRRRRSVRVHRPTFIREVAADLSRHYAGFVGYHGCRPLDVTSYYREGLRCHDARTLDECRETVHRITRLPSEDVEAAIQALDRRFDVGCAYLVLDPRPLLRYSSHYLIYGSEFTMAVLAELARQGHHNFQYRLRECGTPTLFQCHIPFSIVKERYIVEIAESLTDEAQHHRWATITSAPWRDHSVVLHQGVPASAIVDHEHPLELTDMHDGGKTYRFAP